MNKTLIASSLLGLSLVLTPAAYASPAMCSGHADFADMPDGYHSDDKYVTACGGDSGPDAGGNNATAPQVDTAPSK